MGSPWKRRQREKRARNPAVINFNVMRRTLRRSQRHRRKTGEGDIPERKPRKERALKENPKW